MQNLQLVTYIVTAITFVGTFANAFHKRWGFLIWIFTNLFWIVYNFTIKEYAQMIIYSVNTVMSIIGFYKWGKVKNNDS